MITFPLNNVEYEANALGAWCGTRTRGVFASDGHYAVTANGDMSVTVSPGLAWLKADTYWGVDMFETNSTVLTLDTADGALSRWAAVCLQLDKNANVGAIVLKYGAYGTNPALSSLPAPVQDSLDYDEIYVAAIQIRAGVTAILTSDITDLRLDETYCGIMRDGVTGIPTQQLAAQWTNWMANFTAAAQAYYGTYQNMVVDSYAAFTATIAVHEANAQQVYNQYEADMGAYEQTAQSEFEAWLATVQATLDGDTAGNLLNLINALTARAARIEATLFHDMTDNPYLFLFANLDDVTATGYWNAELQRIEC